jgi:hypothetical protein
MNWQCDAQRIYCSLSYMEHDDAQNTWRKSCGLEQERWGRHWVGSGKFRSAYPLPPWNSQHNFLLTEWDLMALNNNAGDGVGLALASSGQHIHSPLKFPTEFLAYRMGPRIGDLGWVKPVMQNGSTMQTIHRSLRTTKAFLSEPHHLSTKCHTHIWQQILNVFMPTLHPCSFLLAFYNSICFSLGCNWALTQVYYS